MVFTAKSRDRYSRFRGTFVQVTIFSNFQRLGCVCSITQTLVPNKMTNSIQSNKFRCHEHFLFIGIHKIMEF